MDTLELTINMLIMITYKSLVDGFMNVLTFNILNMFHSHLFLLKSP